jgi:hypothetical protein
MAATLESDAVTVEDSWILEREATSKYAVVRNPAVDVTVDNKEKVVQVESTRTGNNQFIYYTR